MSEKVYNRDRCGECDGEHRCLYSHEYSEVYGVYASDCCGFFTPKIVSPKEIVEAKDV